MIEVTRLNGMPMLVNSDLIKIVESSPDTMLTLIHGEKLIVRESAAELPGQDHGVSGGFAGVGSGAAGQRRGIASRGGDGEPDLGSGDQPDGWNGERWAAELGAEAGAGVAVAVSGHPTRP